MFDLIAINFSDRFPQVLCVAKTVQVTAIPAGGVVVPVTGPPANPPPADGKSFLIDELGILRDLFDLGWLDDVPDGNQSFFGL